MMFGFTLFKCTECGKRYLGTDVEYKTTSYTSPVKCPKCGGMRTRPSRLVGGSDKMYQNIWDEGTKETEPTFIPSNNCFSIPYKHDDSVETNVEKAYEWWSKVSGRGFKEADFCIGYMHFDRGEYETAMEWFLKVLEYPYINEASYQLGVMYENGLGVEKDRQKAIDYYKKGAYGLNSASYLSTEALKRLGVIHLWSELGYSHQILCGEAKKRLGGSGVELNFISPPFYCEFY